MNPFAALADGVRPPAWSGPALVHRIGDDDEPQQMPPPPRLKPRSSKPAPEDWRSLEQLQRKAVRAALLVCPAWTLITPGSPKESLVRQVPAALWWPYPKE